MRVLRTLIIGAMMVLPGMFLAYLVWLLAGNPATEPLEIFLLSFKARAGSTSVKHTDCTLPLAIKLMINGR